MLDQSSLPNSTRRARAEPADGARARGRQRPTVLFRRTSLRRAIAEGVALSAAGGLLALVPTAAWPGPLLPLVLVLRTTLFFVPPVWAAMRVVSTRREKMSRRFWRLGPTLALYCTATQLLLALAIGESAMLGGVATAPDLTRFFIRGAEHLTPGAFLIGAAMQLIGLTIYYTIAVICTRLANGGFLRFTMPAGSGRVTL